MSAVQKKPIKRSKELASLSREHHDGLLLCWKINTGLDNNIPTERIGAYVLNFYDTNLNQHFIEEERYLFPLLPANNPDREEAETHHKMLREMIAVFRNIDQINALSLKYFAETLNTHIRFEERVLFNIIEEEAGIDKLKSIEKNITGHIRQTAEWHDQFWLKKA